MPTYLGNSSSTKEAPLVSILKGSNQSKRKSPLAGEAATTEVMMGTPTDRGNKASRPQGTSPMARYTEKDDDLEIESLGVIEIDGEEDASMEEDDQDSIAMAISSARKALFASASGTKSSRSNKSWKPITAKDTSTQDAVASSSATFAAETVFHERAPRQDNLKDKRLRGAHAIQAAALRRPRDPHRPTRSLPLGSSGAGQVGLCS